MYEVYRPAVKVGSCITLSDMSVELGGSIHLLRMAKNRGLEGFPSKVAKFGYLNLYVKDELDAFYKSMLWRQADRSIKELTGDLEHEAS